MRDHPDEFSLPNWILQRLIAAFVIGTATVGAWYALLGWDDHYAADGSGPYEAWQVVVLVAVLGGIAVGAGCLGFPFVAILLMPTALGWAAYRDWGADDRTGLFMIGVQMVTAGAFVGVALAAIVGFLVAPRQRRIATGPLT